MNGNGKREREAAGEEEVSSLEEEIANILQVFRDVTTVATDCPEESLRLFKQLNNVVESLNKIDSHRHLDPAHPTLIPVDVLSFIDSGRNPDLATKLCIEMCFKSAEASAGKALAVQTFREELERELQRAYPEESMEYKMSLQTGPNEGNVQE